MFRYAFYSSYFHFSINRRPNILGMAYQGFQIYISISTCIYSTSTSTSTYHPHRYIYTYIHTLYIRNIYNAPIQMETWGQWVPVRGGHYHVFRWCAYELGCFLSRERVSVEILPVKTSVMLVLVGVLWSHGAMEVF